MFIHKLLRGAGAELYLPFGLARLRALERIKGPKAYWTQKYQVPGFEIEVQQAPPFQYLRILATGGIRYEFFTSEHVDDTMSTPGFDGYVGGSAQRVGFTPAGAQTPKPLYSTVFTPGVDDPWLLRDTTAVNSLDSGLITWNSWQSQKMQEHVWHRTGAMVTSTQGQPAGIANKCNWNSPYISSPYTTFEEYNADYGHDVLPTLYSAQGAVVAAPVLEYSWLNWRRAAVQATPGGQFFISTDNFGRFHVYRVINKLPTGLTTDFKTYTPPYPAWVTLPDITDQRQRINDWLWRFNSDATKCVSVPFHAEPNTDFKKYVGPGPAAIFGTILHPEDTGTIDPTYLLTAHDDTPGLVELGIEITVTGTGPLDFDVTFTVLRTEYFEDNYRFFFDAAYFLADVEKIGIPKDTLLTAEVQCKVPTGGYEAEVVIEMTSTVIEVDHVENMQSHCVLQSNDASMTPTELLRFPIFTPLYMGYPNATYVRTYGYPDMVFGTPFGASYAGATIPTSGGDVDYFPIGPAGGLVGGSPLRSGYLSALELSTLSVVYSSIDHLTQEAFLRGLSFGVEYFKYITDPADVEYRNVPPLLDPVVTVPSARPYQTALGAMLAIAPGQGFCVHPSGYWSFAAVGVLAASADFPDGGGDVDWISAIRGYDDDGRPIRYRYRHRDLFNTAFGQTRDYDYYDTESFPGKNLIDHGGFRTTGYWVSF